MSRVTIDPQLAKTLGESRGPIDLVDLTGQIVGRFVPMSDLDRSELSEEETRRRLAPGRKRYSTEQVIDHLRNLQ